jgi:phosphate transport system permease protein
MMDGAPIKPRMRRSPNTPLWARGEPYVWLFGGALLGGIFMIAGFLLLIAWNGSKAFWPGPVAVMTLKDGRIVAGEPVRTETFIPPSPDGAPSPSAPAIRALYRTGNFDLTNEDFVWIGDDEVKSVSAPEDILFVERLQWGPFIGGMVSVNQAGRETAAGDIMPGDLERLTAQARARREAFLDIQRGRLSSVNRKLEADRLSLRKSDLARAGKKAEASPAGTEKQTASLMAEYQHLAAEAEKLDKEDAAQTITLAAADGTQKTIRISEVVRFYAPNAIGPRGKLGVYISRWREFLTQEPREANTEGGVAPAIFGTFVMTVMMALLVAPFGVVAALYLREYARQGWLVSLVRVSVNNMAGVPSIVYGVFGLGFFAYGVGGWMDAMFYPERLPSPTFGAGGLLWASLTLAMLTAPVVIVATEEALSAVPQSAREGSLACGASKWQTIRYIVLPQALPGIMTGLILAMARGAGEVAPLMLVGVVKLAPALPVDAVFPYVHLERSFMCLGFHIYDVGFQSRNAEAGKPMVFMTTLLLMAVVAVLNAGAIIVRNRLKARHGSGHF